MSTRNMDLIHSSVESRWMTPAGLFHALNGHFRFDIDAAADSTSALRGIWFGPDSPWAEDGLRADWLLLAVDRLYREPVVFLNPPYSKTEYQKTRNPAMLVGRWAEKCWEESKRGCTIVGLFPFAPQTEWYRHFVMGLDDEFLWKGHAAMEEWRLPHRVSFLHPEKGKLNNAGVNSVVLIWRPNPGFVGPWTPATRYWSYR